MTQDNKPRAFTVDTGKTTDVKKDAQYDTYAGFTTAGMLKHHQEDINDKTKNALMELDPAKEQVLIGSIKSYLKAKFLEPALKLYKITDDMSLSQFITAIGKLRSIVAEGLTNFEETDQAALAKLLIETSWGEGLEAANPKLQRDTAGLIVKSLVSATEATRGAIYDYLRSKKMADLIPVVSLRDVQGNTYIFKSMA